MKKLKSLFFLISAMVLIIILGLQISAKAESLTPRVYLNEKIIEFDVSPYIENGRTFIPVRAVSESLKYNVLWNEEDFSVKIDDGIKTITLYIGKNEYVDSGEIKVSDVAPVIISGRTFVPLRLVSESFGCNVDWNMDEYAVYLKSHKTVEAKDATELLTAVANDTRILLTGDEYNLSQVDFSKINNPYIKPGEYCEKEIVISSVQNLIIEGKEGCDIELVTEEAYANVLCFDDCKKIGLVNFTAGHKVEKGSCIGGVIRFYNSKSSYIENCRLYGCGTYGVTGEYANNINVYNTEIYECSYGAISFYLSRDIVFDKCIFRDCAEYDIFGFSDCTNINVNNSLIKNNKSSEWFALINSINSDGIKFNECIFDSNTAVNFSIGDGIEINKCTIK